MFEHNYNNIWRLMSFVKNVNETKRHSLGMSNNEYRIQIGMPRSTYNGFVWNKKSSLDLLFKISNYIPVEIALEYNGCRNVVKSPEEFVSVVVKCVDVYTKQNGLKIKTMAEAAKVSESNYRNLRVGKNKSKAVLDRLIKKIGITINVRCALSPHVGEELRAKRLAANRRRRKTEQIESDVYVSEYKKEIKERMKKLWP